MEIKGIDVSHHQGTIDWAKVKNAGVEFALLRVGYSAKTGKGGLVMDRQFVRNATECNKIGIPIGAYVYCYDDSPEASKLTAEAVVAAIKPYRISYPVVYDIEYENNAGMRDDVNDKTVISAMEAFEKAGYYGMVYASKDFFKNHMNLEALKNYDKWEAAYTQKDTPEVPNGLWQYSSSGSVPGIAGKVDMDIAYKDYKAIIANAGLNHLSAHSTPMPVSAPVHTANTEFKVRTNVPALRIRTGAGITFTAVGQLNGKVEVAISETKPGAGSDTGWGHLADGRGWIALDHCVRV